MGRPGRRMGQPFQWTGVKRVLAVTGGFPSALLPFPSQCLVANVPRDCSNTSATLSSSFSYTHTGKHTHFSEPVVEESWGRLEGKPGMESSIWDNDR